jgi:hypothetical protein
MRTIFIVLLLQIKYLWVITPQEKEIVCKSEQFKNELENFIDNTKMEFKGSARFLVFVVHLYEGSKRINSKDLCFTLGYILNSFEVPTVAPEFILYHKEEIILVRGNEKRHRTLFRDLGIKKIAQDDIIKLKNKLSEGSFTYIGKGLTYCNVKGKVNKTFYNNADEIPLEKSIYGNFPEGVRIRKVN